MLTREWLSSFTPIGAIAGPGKWAPYGAGVLLHHPPFVWVVTASHVIRDVGENHVGILVTQRKGGVTVVDVTGVHASQGLAWLHDEKRDVAVALMPVSPEWDLKGVPEKLCLNFEKIIPSMPCFTVGCPYGVPGLDPSRAVPLVLDGVVSGVDAQSGTIFVSAPTFPGNSGGPIIVYRSPMDAMGGMTVGVPPILLAGIVRQMALLRGPDVKEPVPYLHLGLGTPISAAINLITSDEANAQTAKLPVEKK